MTLAEFCVYVKKMMDLYGEEILTDKEMEILLVTYGTKLPYGLEDQEQFEAIKYLMAKGIVSDSMYWEGNLTIEDMLVILSRVKDEGSRLTFKEIEIEYDPDLVSMGYCPAEMTFVEETSIGVVSTTLNESYNYSNAEWFDYFLRMPATIKSADGKKEVNPRFIRTEGAQEYVTTDLFVTQRGVKDTKKNNDKEDLSEDEKYTYVRSDTSQEGKDGIEVLGYENLNDGYEYLHIRVKTSLLLKDGSPNKEYVNPNNDCIYINTTDSTDAPTCWKVDYRGGVFRNPVLSGSIIKWESGAHYTDEGTKYTRSTNTVDLSSYEIKLEDFDKLSEHKTCKSLVVSLNIDGTVKDAYTYTNKKGKDDTLKYMTFDQAGWSYKYCDYDRYVNHLAISFARNPMLSDNTSFGEALASMVPQYDIWFYVLCSKDDTTKLSSSLYLGDNKVVDAAKPKEILDSDSKIEFLAYNNGKYYYVVRGQNTEAWLSNNLKTESGSSINASYATGYIKQNNTVLVQDTDLFKIAESTSGIYTNGAITALNEDTICISFDVKNSSYFDTLTCNIYMCESLKLLAVNNMIYKIPDDEVLFVDNTESGGGYLINGRAVLGWKSGYVSTNSLGDNKVELCLSTNKSSSQFYLQYTNPGIVNAFTGLTTSLVGITNSEFAYDVFSVPATAPNNVSSWFVYQSDSSGIYAFTFKNNDDKALNSVVDNIAEDTASAVRYADGPLWLDELFGVAIGSTDWKNSDILVSAYSLTDSSASDYVVDYEDVQNCKDMKDISGKFYHDNNLGTWAYIPYVVSLSDNPCVSFFAPIKYDSLNNKDLYGYSQSLHALVGEYYRGTLLLPYVINMDGITSKVIDISCNVHDGAPYGAVPLWAVQIEDTYFKQTLSTMLGYPVESIVNNGLVWGKYKVSDRDRLFCTSFTMSDSNELCVDADNSLLPNSDGKYALSTIVPPNPVPFILGLLPYTLDKETFPSGLDLLLGNYPLVYRPDAKKGEEIQLVTTMVDNKSPSLYYMSAEGKEVYLIGLTMTKQLGFLSTTSDLYKVTSNRNILTDKTTQASLEDLEQIGGVNWGAYTFDNLIHDVDNGLSILLIIVLNIIPRIGMFVFIILIGLSTVANMKPVRRFCDSIFDPYKLITLGHCTVYTINTKLLLISSIIGLAAFGLFMDGTLINLLTWLVQFVSAFVTR